MAKRRKQCKRAKDDEIVVSWGCADGDGPDVCVDWGANTEQATARLIISMLCDERLYEGRTLAEELKRRGFDLETIEFRIRKKQR